MARVNPPTQPPPLDFRMARMWSRIYGSREAASRALGIPSSTLRSLEGEHERSRIGHGGTKRGPYAKTRAAWDAAWRDMPRKERIAFIRGESVLTSLTPRQLQAIDRQYRGDLFIEDVDYMYEFDDHDDDFYDLFEQYEEGQI